MGDGSDDALAETGLAETRASEPSLTATPTPAALGRYVIRGTVGSGGMGVVYRAHDPELGRLVALKVMRPTGSGGSYSSSRGRLVREAQAMAKVSHPNVIVVHDAGSVGDDVFVAMELVEGEDLAVWEKRPHSWREILEVYLQAGRGLAAAHRAGLVHRDFKPANALVGPDGRVRVLDFGLARTLDEAETSRASRPSRAMLQLTETGAVMGTPQFMSPEQHLAETPDARSDQFSFCVALYHALYGAYPFTGATYAELSTSVIDGVPAAPPRTTRVPAAVGRAVMRGLSRQPSARFATLDELIAALEQGMRRRAWPFVAAGVLLVIAAALFAVSRRDRAAAPVVDLGKHMQDVTQSGEEATSPDLSPDGTRLAWASGDGVVVRELATGQARQFRYAGKLWSVRWSPRGDRLLATTDHGALVVDVTTGSIHPYNQKISTTTCHSAWSPDATRILWQCDPDPSHWATIDVDTGATTPLTIAVPDAEMIVDVDWSAAGIALSTEGKTDSGGLWIANAAGGDLRRVHAETLLGSVRWNARGTRLYFVHSTEQSFEIAYYDLASRKRVVVLAQPQGEFVREPMFTISADERTLYYRQLRLRDDVLQQTIGADEGHYVTVDHRRKAALARSADDTQLAFAAGTTSRKRIFIMTRATGAVHEVQFPEADIQRIAFSPTGDALAVASLDPEPRLSIVSLRPGAAAPRVLDVAPFATSMLVWTKSDSLVVADGALTNLLIVDPATGASRPMFDQPQADLTWSVLSPDGTKLAATVATSDFTAALVTLTPPHGERTILAAATTAGPFAWSDDEAWVISDESPPDDGRLRVIATSAAGHGGSRLLGLFSGGSNPILLDHGASIAFISFTRTTDIWMASADAHPPLPQGPIPVPPPRPPPLSFNAAPMNLELAGAPGTTPAGWESKGSPRAVVTDDCGRRGTCVVIDGASRGSLGQRVDAAAYRGRRLKMSFDAQVDGGATVFVGVNSVIFDRSLLPSGQIALTDEPWTHHEILVDVAPDAKFIELKALASRAGHARVANVTLAPAR